MKPMCQKIRVALVQLNPRIGEIEANTAKVWRLLQNVPPCDLVVLPELAITGYNFPNKKAITPYLEGETRFTSTELAKQIATKLGCFTAIGYPEISRNTIYNSCKLVDPNGNEVYNYRKTHLYETDEVWGCSENPDRAFKSIEIDINGSNIVVNFGICMDLNPYKFEAPFNVFEFSTACHRNRAKLIICPMAWLSPYSPSIQENVSNSEQVANGQKFHQILLDQASDLHYDTTKSEIHYGKHAFIPSLPDESTVNYWILRFFPFLGHNYNSIPRYGNVSILTCNRVGVEHTVLYGGSSSIIQFSGEGTGGDLDMSNPSVKVAGSLPAGNEGVLYREITI